MALATPSLAARGLGAPRAAARALGALGLGGLAFFVLHIQLGTGGAALDDFANRWLYQALYEREPGMRSHATIVAALAVALAQRIGVGGEELMELRLAAELHDVGKLAVPDAILHKPGPLDEGEWALLRQHPLVGQRILGAGSVLSSVGVIVRNTHERWDGEGYVDGLAGEAIPFGARVIAVCDAFSAMTSDRPYRPAQTPEKALRELRRCAGSQFDPGIVEAFCRAYTDGELTATADDFSRKIA